MRKLTEETHNNEKKAEDVKKQGLPEKNGII